MLWESTHSIQMAGPEVSTVPLVSVIVPVYNQERFLGRCLRSLVAQDFPRDGYEIVVGALAEEDLLD